MRDKRILLIKNFCFIFFSILYYPITGVFFVKPPHGYMKLRHKKLFKYHSLFPCFQTLLHYITFLLCPIIPPRNLSRDVKTIDTQWIYDKQPNYEATLIFFFLTGLTKIYIMILSNFFSQKTCL